MGRKLELPLNETEQLQYLIFNLSSGEKTTRLFNFTLNFNRDELERVLKPTYKSLHDKPEKIEEYEKKLRDLKIEYSALPRSQYQKGKEIPMDHIKDRNKFNSKALDLKKEYQEDLDEWDKLMEENEELKKEIKVEVDLYICPSEQAPKVSAGLEYFLAFMLDYSDEEGVETEFSPHVESYLVEEKKDPKKKSSKSKKKTSNKSKEKEEEDDSKE